MQPSATKCNQVHRVNQEEPSATKCTECTECNQVQYLIDTGSSANVVDQSTFESWKHRPALVPCDARFYGYSASEPIEMLGQFDAVIKHGSNEVKARFVVAMGSQECLLCYETAAELKLLQINSVCKGEVPVVELTDPCPVSKVIFRKAGMSQRGEYQARCGYFGEAVKTATTTCSVPPA